MEKAYDLKVLEKKLLAQGLPLVENLAEKAYAAVKEWIVESAPVSETKIDDIVVPLAFPVIDAVVIPAINKIDGIEG